MKNVFIDTNIWLSLYHFTNDDLSQFERFKNMINQNINLIVPQQVYDEITRNRENKILDALKSFDLKIPKAPVFCKGYDDYKELKEDLTSVKEKFDKFKKEIEKDIINEELLADKVLKSFFDIVELIPCDKYVEKAYNRYKIGNPPGKNNSYGDAINWECLLDNINNGEDLYLISSDKDYSSLICNDNVNEFLAKEWKNKKNSTVYFYSTLVGFLKEHVKEIHLEKEICRQKFILELMCSTSYFTTREMISILDRYSDWTKEEIEIICLPLLYNSQVREIILEDNILEFYNTILSNVKYDEVGECTKKAFEIIKEINVESSEGDCETEINDILE